MASVEHPGEVSSAKSRGELSASEASLGETAVVILEALNTGKKLVLPVSELYQGERTVGRRPENAFVLSAGHISGLHCKFRWTVDERVSGTGEVLRDLELLVIDESSNGTFVDNNRIPKGRPVRLGDGQIVSFAKQKSFDDGGNCHPLRVHLKVQGFATPLPPDNVSEFVVNAPSPVHLGGPGGFLGAPPAASAAAAGLVTPTERGRSLAPGGGGSGGAGGGGAMMQAGALLGTQGHTELMAAMPIGGSMVSAVGVGGVEQTGQLEGLGMGGGGTAGVGGAAASTVDGQGGSWKGGTGGGAGGGGGKFLHFYNSVSANMASILDQQERENEKLKEEREKLQKSLKEKQREVEKEKQKRKLAEEEVERQVQRAAQLTERVQKEKERADAADRVREEKEQIEEKAALSAAKVASLQSDLDAQTLAVEQSKKEGLELREKLRAAEVATEQSQRREKQTRSEVEDALKKLEASRAEVETLKERLEDESRRRADAETTGTNQEEELRQVRQELSKKTEEAATLMELKAQGDRRHSSLTAEHAATQRALLQAQSRGDEKEKALTALREDVGTMVRSALPRLAAAIGRGLDEPEFLSELAGEERRRREEGLLSATVAASPTHTQQHGAGPLGQQSVGAGGGTGLGFDFGCSHSGGIERDPSRDRGERERQRSGGTPRGPVGSVPMAVDAIGGREVSLSVGGRRRDREGEGGAMEDDTDLQIHERGVELQGGARRAERPSLGLGTGRGRGSSADRVEKEARGGSARLSGVSLSGADLDGGGGGGEGEGAEGGETGERRKVRRIDHADPHRQSVSNRERGRDGDGEMHDKENSSSQQQHESQQEEGDLEIPPIVGGGDVGGADGDEAAKALLLANAPTSVLATACLHFPVHPGGPEAPATAAAPPACTSGGMPGSLPGSQKDAEKERVVPQSGGDAGREREKERERDRKRTLTGGSRLGGGCLPRPPLAGSSSSSSSAAAAAAGHGGERERALTLLHSSASASGHRSSAVRQSFSHGHSQHRQAGGGGGGHRDRDAHAPAYPPRRSLQGHSQLRGGGGGLGLGRVAEEDGGGSVSLSQRSDRMSEKPLAGYRVGVGSLRGGGGGGGSEQGDSEGEGRGRAAVAVGGADGGEDSQQKSSESGLGSLLAQIQ